MQQNWKQLAASYDCTAYGSGNYNNTSCTTATDSGLVPTGENITVGLIGGLLLVAIAVVMLIRLRRSKKTTK